MNNNKKSVAFDLLRGIAALLVCVSHIRNFLFVDFLDITNPNFFDKLFYFATGLGHQAVVVFFVLSGYFVGGAVWKQLNRGGFSWIEYTLARLSRLWVVLIPALLATLIFDSLGKSIIDNAGYDGRWKDLLSSGPGVGVDSIDLSLITFFGNVLFLQTIAVPVFGTNGPLWSLANEFWYYLIFPFVAIAIYKRSILSLFSIVIMGGLFGSLPSGISNGFLFWLMGWLAAIAGRVDSRVKWWHILMSMVVFGAALVSTKFLSGFSSELVVAVSTMLLLVVLPYVNLSNWMLVRGVSGFSDMSYSVYLFHFPFVAFCWFVFIAPSQLQPTIFGYGQFFILLAVTLIFCLTMWWFFERHTGHVRNLLQNGLRAVR